VLNVKHVTRAQKGETDHIFKIREKNGTLTASRKIFAAAPLEGIS
jgi:hypothetical protein